MAEISAEELKEYKALKKSRQAQYKRQNQYIKENLYRVSVTFPKDFKERLQAAGVGSVNGYINRLVAADLARLEAPELPAETPNTETLEAIRELDDGGGETFESVDALFESWAD